MSSPGERVTVVIDAICWSAGIGTQQDVRMLNSKAGRSFTMQSDLNIIPKFYAVR